MAAPLGNKNALKAKRWRAALERALAAHAGSVDLGLDALAKIRLDQALAGDPEAMREFGDRFDGKPAQAIIGGDEDDNPIRIEGRIKLVRPSSDS